MSVVAREGEDIGKVFDDLCLSRKVMKRAEGTQTPPLKEVSVPGEVPDDCVSSLIEMLTPSLRQHHSSRTNSNEDSSESSPLLGQADEISVDRTSSKKTKKVVIKEGNSIEKKEVFEELCLSRKKTSFTMSNDLPPSEARRQEQEGELMDGNVASTIEMLRPSIGQLYNKNGISTRTEKPEKVTESKEKALRAYLSEPNVVAPVPNTNVSSTLSEVSLDSIFTTPSNLTETLDENLIKTLLLSQQQMDKGFVEAASNTEASNRNSKRKNKKKRKRSRVKIIKDSGTETIYQTEDSTNQTDEIISEESNEVQRDRNNTLEIREQCDLSIELENTSSKDTNVENGITVLRNRTDWTDSPFLPQESSDTVEESTSNVDSEPTRGCPSALQYKIQFNSADKSNSNAKTEIKRFKAILHPGRRQADKKESENGHKQDFESRNFFNKPITNTQSPGDKFQDNMFPSHSSLSSPENSTGTSLTSIRTYCSSCNGEEKLGNCCCNTFLGDTRTAPGEPKVFWAITKINVYPDDSRTYEVMPLTGKKPAELPEKSDSVFVLIPPKPGHIVPSNLE